MIREARDALLERHRCLVLEGAGGPLTPLTERDTVADLIRALDAVAIVVVPVRLGAISQALLSVRALEACGVAVGGIVLNDLEGAPGPGDGRRPPRLRELEAPRAEIARWAGVPVLGTVPRLGRVGRTELVRAALAPHHARRYVACRVRRDHRVPLCICWH